MNTTAVRASIFSGIQAWMEERERISRKKKSGKPWPWTTDPILQQYKFCEVYRENDRVTAWIREHWREPYRKHKNLWFAMCVARLINWPDTLEQIGFPTKWEPERVKKIMQQMQAEGRKVFSSAYMTYADNKNGLDLITFTVQKLDAVFRFVENEGAFWLNGCDSLQKVWAWFIGFRGIGGFLAYEIVSDLRWTRYLNRATDTKTWANAGPGATRGLNRIYGRDLKAKPSQGQLLRELREMYAFLDRNRDKTLLPTCEMRECEHAACEWDKYSRAKEALASGKRVGLEMYHRRRVSLF